MSKAGAVYRSLKHWWKVDRSLVDSMREALMSKDNNQDMCKLVFVEGHLPSSSSIK